MPDTPDDPVDAIVLASRGAEVHRAYALAELPRVQAAGGGTGSEAAVRFRFSKVEGGIGVDTSLAGKVVLTCQRCLKPVELPVEAESALVLVSSDAEAEQLPEGREPVVSEAGHLDLAWLAEEEMLLALPLVPMHDAACTAEGDVVVDDEVADEPPEEERQLPFKNLRDLLNKH